MLMPKPLSLLHSRFRSVGSNPNRFVFDRSLWGDYGKWMPVLLGQNLLSVHGDSYLRDTLCTLKTGFGHDHSFKDRASQAVRTVKRGGEIL